MLHELETITPYDYHLIRAGLGHGSGLDSPGFLGLLHMGPRLGEAFQSQLSKLNLTRRRSLPPPRGILRIARCGRASARF